MASKKPRTDFSFQKPGDQYTIEQALETQNALDEGILGSVKTGEWGSFYQSSPFSNPMEQTGNTMANKATFGSLLGQESVIAGNRKKRLEQQTARQQGVGTSQSILGGGSF